MARNAYVVTHTGGTPDNTAPAMPDPDMAAYAVPSVEADAPYTDTFGWSPELRTRVQGEPDAQRLGLVPTHDMRPNPARNPAEWWADRRATVDHLRDSEGTLERGTPFAEDKSAGAYPDPAKGGMRWALNPRMTPPPEPRWTTALAPRTWAFFRLFDQFNRTHEGDPATGSARHLNGMHFSMADHRRNYDPNLLGMAPQRNPGAGTRNTYRLEPAPWDEDVVDMPPPATIGVQQQVRTQSVDVAYNSMGTARSWRL
jgi:hypothetical protein